MGDLNDPDQEKQTADFPRYQIVSSGTKTQSEPDLHSAESWNNNRIYYFRNVIRIHIHVRDFDWGDAPDCRFIIFFGCLVFLVKDCQILLYYKERKSPPFPAPLVTGISEEIACLKSTPKKSMAHRNVSQNSG